MKHPSNELNEMEQADWVRSPFIGILSGVLPNTAYWARHPVIKEFFALIDLNMKKVDAKREGRSL